LQPRLHLQLEPHVQHLVQVDVRQQRTSMGSIARFQLSMGILLTQALPGAPETQREGTA
jgi:hypothetical protein